MLFGSVMLPLVTLTLVFVPITKEFGWSTTQFSFAVTILLWSALLPCRCWVIGSTASVPGRSF
jgi:hypothetical protein